jgi:hypothetical protein
MRFGTHYSVRTTWYALLGLCLLVLVGCTQNTYSGAGSGNTVNAPDTRILSPDTPTTTTTTKEVTP